MLYNRTGSEKKQQKQQKHNCENAAESRKTSQKKTF